MDKDVCWKIQCMLIIHGKAFLRTSRCVLSYKQHLESMLHFYVNVQKANILCVPYTLMYMILYITSRASIHARFWMYVTPVHQCMKNEHIFVSIWDIYLDDNVCWHTHYFQFGDVCEIVHYVFSDECSTSQPCQCASSHMIGSSRLKLSGVV